MIPQFSLGPFALFQASGTVAPSPNRKYPAAPRPPLTRPLCSSSDTESTDARPRDERRILSPAKLTGFFRKSRDKVASEGEGDAKVMETDAVKVPLEAAEPRDGLVYAELDLVSQNLRPVVKNDDEKTEYAEIVYAKDGDKEAA